MHKHIAWVVATGLGMLGLPGGALAAQSKLSESQQQPVTSAYITDGTVASADIADGTIATADLAADAVTDAKVVDTLTASNYLPLAGGTLTGGLTLSGVASDIVTGLNEDLALMPNGTGKVGIGTTAPGEKLEVNGNVKAAAFFYSSDAQLKTNIATAPGLALIGQLHGVSFNWKESGQKGLGLLAQEVEPVLPELVATNPATGLKSVSYGHLIGPMIEAIKELNSQLEAQHRQIEQLEQEIRELKAGQSR